jgi:hypothetical protein
MGRNCEREEDHSSKPALCFIALYGTKIGQAVRLAPGNDFSAKALNIMEAFRGFSVTLPSFHRLICWLAFVLPQLCALPSM